MWGLLGSTKIIGESFDLIKVGFVSRASKIVQILALR